MARGDLSVLGPQGTMHSRIAASATRYEVGEPLYLDGTTLTSGAASANTAELMDADGVVTWMMEGQVTRKVSTTTTTQASHCCQLWRCQDIYMVTWAYVLQSAV